MTYEGMFDEINCMQDLKELKKELKKLKEDKTRGQNDLEKTIDVLKTDRGYTAKIDVDRSKFDVRYGSDSFFDKLD